MIREYGNATVQSVIGKFPLIVRVLNEISGLELLPAAIDAARYRPSAISFSASKKSMHVFDSLNTPITLSLNLQNP